MILKERYILHSMCICIPFAIVSEVVQWMSTIDTEVVLF